MPQFDFATYGSQIFWLVLTFGLLYFFVSKFIAPKIESTLLARMNVIEDDIIVAENAAIDADKLNVQKQEYVDQLNEELNALQQEAVSMVEKSYEAKQKILSAKLETESSDALKKLESDVSQFHIDEQASCLDLAAFIIHRITNKKVDSKELHRYYQT